VSSADAIDEVLKAEFRRGFYAHGPAGWIEAMSDESGDVVADVAGCLAAIEAGQRNFSYPRHDEAVFDLLDSLVPLRGLRRGADIGCLTGCFPAMQLAAGIEQCTVFEIRPVEVNDDRVDVRVQDLTYAETVRPEFDLVTCLSTIEHVGLGRYGDRLDPWGDVKLARNLEQLLRPGGIALLSFPVGRGCVVFNQHRIYSPRRRSLIFGDLRLIERRSGRSALGQARHKVEVALNKPQASSQPVYVLERPS
jgi:SAM-dependent methyltransferase